MPDIQKHFPNLRIKINGCRLVYLDNAATTLKPQSVIDAVNECHSLWNANVHRSAHTLSVQTTQRFETIRQKVAAFFNINDASQIIFTSGTTEAINGLAASFSRRYLQNGDEIIISVMEHHSNYVPWFIIAKDRGLSLKIIKTLDNGELDLEAYKQSITSKTKLVAITHASHVLGTINPVHQMTSIAHAHGVPVLVDGAQSVAHFPIDLSNLDCDFFVFSGHKMFAPTGVGVLFGKKKFLEEMPPFKSGGEMVEVFDGDHLTFRALPFKFEAGTPAVSGVFGLGAAIDFINVVGHRELMAIEGALLEYATKRFSEIKGLTIVGHANNKVPVISFCLQNVHPHDVATVCDADGVAVRSGNLCAQPLLQHLNFETLLRVSLSIYNTRDDIDACVASLKKVRTLFQ